MPELPEVETTVRGLARYLDGERIERVALNRPDMRFPFPEGLVQALTGARVTGLGRRAKYGLIHTDRATTLVFHLGMSGRWRIDPAEPAKHDHLVIETAGHRFALHDPRRFGFVDLVDTAALERWPAFAVMGPEPLGPGLTAEHLRAALKGRKPAIKLMLLDQRIVAGLGNIYVCEALFRARHRSAQAGRQGHAPGARAAGAGDPRGARAGDRRRRLDACATTPSPTASSATSPAASTSTTAKASRAARRARGTVQRIVQSGRSTWFCPKCQK